jgi:hypothetical protein
LTEKSKNNSKKDLLKYLILLLSAHTVFLIISGYFSIGLLSDDYLNFISAQSSTLSEKFTSSIPYYSNFHFRPIWFMSIDLSIFINSLFTSSENNFIFYRIENLLWFYILMLISANFLYKITGSKFSVLMFTFVCIIFPNNLINICWTAGKVDLICAIFLISALTWTYSYIIESKKKYLIYTLILFLSALMTKETAVVFPLICIVFFTMVFGKDILKKIRILIISEFLILIVYIFYKIFELKNSPADVVTTFQDPGILGSLNVIFKAIISLVIPFDYLTIQYDLFRFDFYMILYMLIVFIFIICILCLFYKNKEIRSLIFIAGLFLISISPNLIGGYFRPQLILIPFIIFGLSVFIIISRFETIPKFTKTISAVVFSIWILLSFNLIKDMEYASEVTKTDSGIMCRENFDFKNKEKIYVIGLPSRYNQAIIMNYVSGQYNYYCNNEFKLTDNVSDIIHTGALDEISLNSELELKVISVNEFEISTTGETQYLLKLDLVKNEFKDKDLEIIFSDLNSFKKPTKANVKILTGNSDVYLFSKEKFTLLKMTE